MSATKKIQEPRGEIIMETRSNTRRSRLYRISRATIIAAVTLLVAASAYIHIEQFLFRRHIDQLLTDVRALEIGKTSAKDTRRVAQKWGFQQVIPEGKSADEVCDYRLEQRTPVDGILGFFGWRREAVRILILLGGRPALVTTFLLVRHGTLWSRGFTLWISAPGPDDQGFVIGSAGTARPGSWRESHSERPPRVLAGSLRHENYLVGTHVALMSADYAPSSVPVIWVEFSPSSDAKDVTRLMQFDLGCLTRLRSCQATDLMPTVWSELMAEEQSPPAKLMCTTDLVQHVARLADAIVVVRIDSPELEPPPPDTAWTFRLPEANMVRLVSGPRHLRDGFGRGVEVDSPEIAIAADTGTRLQAGEQYIFLLKTHVYGGGAAVALYPCGILTLNQSNLTMVQQAAAEFIE